jgi:hypothetical protein
VLGRCPHEHRETREGFFIAVPTFHFSCTCPDRAAWNCDPYRCLCDERRAVPVD